MLNSPRLIPVLVVVLCLCCFALPATAGDKDGLSSPLGDIEWGDKPDAVVSKVKKQMLAGLRKRDELKNDRVLLQRERKRLLDEVDRFKKSYEKLDGDTNYRVSVISDEFIKDNGEALMRVKDKVANRYYFFIDGGLYKMVVAYNQQYLEDVGFETFAVQTAKKYGKPSDSSYGTVDGEEVLTQAVWEDSDTVLKVTNKREFFGTFTMTFAERSTSKRLAEKRKAMGDDEGEEVSSRVKALTARGSGKGDDDIVDSIVGDSEINLNEGRPVDEQVRHGEGDGSGDAVAAKKESSKKKKKKRKRKKKKKKKKKRDFGDIEASSGGDDLIIY